MFRLNFWRAVNLVTTLFNRLFFGIIFCLWSTLLSKKKFWFSSRSLSMSCIILFNGFYVCAKDVLVLFFSFPLVAVSLLFVKLQSSPVKAKFSSIFILLTSSIILNWILSFPFTVIYSFANKLVISLFAISKIKITILKIRFICFCSKLSRVVFIDTRTVYSQTDLITSIC